MQILLIESNPAEVYLTVEALKRAGVGDSVTVTDDSEKALDGLRSSTLRPDVILLDLNVAPISGLEFLAALRSESSIGLIPVIILSGSENKQDIRRAYEIRANCYINKPARLEEFFRVLKTFYDFWGTVVTLPPK